jgi:putative phosphoesterase
MREKPDVIVHLGDHISDAIKLKQQLPETDFYMVMGNMDFQAVGDRELFVSFDNVSILITHGHLYGVKEGFDRLIERGQDLEANIILHGHTHALSLREEFGRVYMCPGQIQYDNQGMPATYGVITINDGQFKCTIESLL